MMTTLASQQTKACGTVRRLHDLMRDRAANTALEFALLAPLLCFMLIGLAFFAIGLFQFTALNEGVRSGARQLATSLNDTTPYSDAKTALENAAPALNTSNLSITMTVNGSSCSSNSSCPLAGGTAATVSATYPCKVVVMGYNFLPSCSLTSTATEMTE
jgi:Flp pilus assembly protein TadG